MYINRIVFTFKRFLCCRINVYTITDCLKKKRTYDVTCASVCVRVWGGHFSRYPTHKCKLRLSASAELGHLAFMGLSFFFLLLKRCFVVFFFSLFDYKTYICQSQPSYGSPRKLTYGLMCC